MRRLCMTFVVALIATPVVGVQAQDERRAGTRRYRVGFAQGVHPGGRVEGPDSVPRFLTMSTLSGTRPSART